jgi:GNAT superfamily N-acetyltransferase
VAADNPEYVLEFLKPGDTVTGFKIGGEQFLPLKNYFQKDAKRFHANSIARTYVFRSTTSAKIIAYMTLICGEIETMEGDGLAADADPFPYSSYPAVKVARLLVDSRHRRKEIGRALIDFAVGRAKRMVCPAAGCRFIVVDAKADSVGFYAKCGFTMLETEENRARPEPVMFIDLYRASAAH